MDEYSEKIKQENVKLENVKVEYQTSPKTLTIFQTFANETVANKKCENRENIKAQEDSCDNKDAISNDLLGGQNTKPNHSKIESIMTSCL